MKHFLKLFGKLVLVIAIRTVVEIINDVIGKLKSKQPQSA